MKKNILFLLLMFIFLVSCSKNEINNISFNKEPETEYIVGTTKEDVLKNITIKIQRKKGVEIKNVTNEMIEDLILDKVGSYTMTIKYEGKELKWKYVVKNKPWDGTIDTTWYDDTSKSYLINNPNELAGLAKLVNEGRDFKDKMITLTADIDLGDNMWVPIGTDGRGVSTAENNYFSGEFDGNNHLISNVRIIAKHNEMGEHIDASESYYNCGLFGQMRNGSIKNLKIKNVTIQNGMMNNGTRAMQGTGSLVGWINGSVTISDVQVSGKINIRGEYKVGGIVGNISKDLTKIQNVKIEGDKESIIFGSDEQFKDTNNFGGIVGFSDSSNLLISDCESDITVSGYTSGGIIGCASNESTVIDNCKVLGITKDPEGSICGGIMGGRFASITIKNCSVLGCVSIGELEENLYADVLVSKYGTVTKVNVSNNSYNVTTMSDKIFNSLNATPITVTINSKAKINDLNTRFTY